MVQEQVLNQLMIFFTCKNILIVLLELYRIFVVQCKQPEEESTLMLQCPTKKGGGEEEAGREERDREQTHHEERESGNEMEEDHRGTQV